MNDRHYMSEQAHKFGVTSIDYLNYCVLRTCVNEYLVKSRHSFIDKQIHTARSESNLNRLKEYLQEQKSLPPKPSFVLVCKVLEDRAEALKESITQKWEQLIKDDSPFVDSCQTLLHDITNLVKDLKASKNPLFSGEEATDSENMLIESGKEIRDFLKESCKLSEAKAKLYAAKLVDDNVSDGIKGLVKLFTTKELEDKITFITDELERMTILHEITKKSFRVESLEVVNVMELVSSDPTISSVNTFDGIYSGEFSLLGRTQKVVIKTANPRRDLKTENLIYDMIGNDSGHIIQKFCYHSKPEYLVLEYFGEDLRFYMEPNSDIKLAILKKVLLAINFLHDQGICHLDLKPQNILVQPNSRGTVHVKICDLESARRINDSFPFSTDGLRFTKDWVAPEVYANKSENSGSFKANYSIDMFSLGLIIAALLDNRCNPEFVVYPPQPDQFERALTNQEYLYSLAPCDNHGRLYGNHVLCLLKLEPSERYSIRDFFKVLEENSISNVHKENIVLQRKLHHLKSNVMNKLDQLYIMSQTMESKMSLGFELLRKTVINIDQRKVPTTFCIVEKAVLGRKDYPPRQAISNMEKVFNVLTNPSQILGNAVQNAFTDKMCLFLLCECCYQPQTGMAPWPIEISEPKAFVPYVLPLARAGLVAAAAVNQGMKIGKLFGLPTPTLSDSDLIAANGFLSSITASEASGYDFLQQKVYTLWEKNRESGSLSDTPKTFVDDVGASEFCIRVFESFVLKYDTIPNFCGLSRVQNANNGSVSYVCRSCITNPAFQN
jgi:serine/threonine protein kinase